MKKSLMFALGLLVLPIIHVYPQTWNGSVSSNWNTATNWTPNNVPTTLSNVIINNAVASYQPVLPGNVSIRTLSMSAGFLNLNSFTLTCSVSATLIGDSLYNGKISSATFNNLANMHMGGKIIFDRTGSANETWQGKNKFYGDSLIIIWRSGSLSMEGAASSPDSIFGNLRLVYSDNNSAVYRINLAVNSPLYVQNDLILDNPDKGVFGLDYANEKIIGGNIKALDFSNAVANLPLTNVTVLGSDVNGPFYSHTATIDNCRFNGNFTLVADSNVAVNIRNSSFLGANNLFQSGTLDFHDNKFGRSGNGTTTLRATNSVGANTYMRDGFNKFFGNARWETYALYPAGVTIQQNFYGADSCWGNMSYILKGNSALTTNGNGHNYVAGNVIIDGQGARKWVQFTGGAGNTFNVDGSFTVKNFTPFSEAGVGNTNVHLRNLFVAATDTVGTFYCYTGDITGCSFNGDFKLIADSSQLYVMNYSSFLGANNLFQSGTLHFHDNKFGQSGPGTTTLRATNSIGSNTYMRDGLNKFYGNAQWETYALYPAGVTIQQTFYGADSVLGNLNFILKGNSSLTTNGEGNNYVAGNLTIDGQGARKWVQFTGGAGRTFNVGGSFTVKNFTPFSEAGVENTNVHLRNLFAAGTDTVGTFYCTTGDINACIFHGNLKLIADSSQGYVVNNSFLLGADNLLQAGIVETQNNKFGQIAAGTTILKSVLNSGSSQMRDGNNKFFGDAQWDVVAPPSGSILIHQTFFGPDSCMGNLLVNVRGATSANLGGSNLYIGKGLSLVNNGSGVIVHDNGSSAIYFIGADTANYFHGGSGSVPSLQNIGLNRRGGLRLMSPLTCSGLILTRGIILSSASNLLQMPNVAVVVGGGDSSYVDGPMKKTGNSEFTFPLGKNNIYAPVSITAPALTTEAFTAQYFNHLAQSDGYDSTQKDVSLNHLSRKEYWMLNRVTGSSSVKVTLSWKTLRSGFVTSISDLRVAHWNGNMWKDEGNGSANGSNTEGTIQSFNTIGSFSPFTIASTNAGNALPLRYISFDAQPKTNGTVLLSWKTADEVNNDRFEVERSKDTRNWLTLASVSPQFSHEYSYTDLFPENAMNYYRVKETDIDGKYFYSDIKLVRIGKSSAFSLWPNPAKENLFLEIPFTGGVITISDINGRLIGKYSNIGYLLKIPIQKLDAGVYILKIESGKEKIIHKFVKE